MRKGKRFSKASAISDRSGFRFPMNEMVIEPGTNFLVHRSESDGQYSLVSHPLNNMQRYLKGKSGDPFPVHNARPDINHAQANVYITTARMSGSATFSAFTRRRQHITASFTGTASFAGDTYLSYPFINDSDSVEYTDFTKAANYTFSGSDVTAVNSSVGPDWQTDAGTTNPEFSSTAFGTKGGLVLTEGTDSLMTASAMTAPGGTARTVLMYLYLTQGTTVGQILSFATGSPPTSGNLAARLVWDGRPSGASSDTPTQFLWTQNQAAGAAKLVDLAYDGYYAVVLRQTSATTVELIINDRANAATFDPSGNGPYAFPWMFLGDASQSGSAGLVGMRVAEIGVLNRYLSDADVDEWLAYTTAKFS